MEHADGLKLYLIERADDDTPHDSWESAVVAAYSEDEARHVYPAGGNWDSEGNRWVLAPELQREWDEDPNEWVDPESVKVTLVGYAHDGIIPGAVIHSSCRNG